jgi:hypothetical protein
MTVHVVSRNASFFLENLPATNEIPADIKDLD